MLGEINRRTRINFPPIPYILKSEFHETFIPSTFSRHVTTFTDRLCYSHSDRIRFASNLSLPPPPRHRRISSRWRKRGIRLEATDTPDSFLLILSVLRYASNVCAVPPFHAFLSLFPSIFLRSSRSKRARSFSKTVDRLLRFFLPRCKVKKKRNSIRLATFPLILFLVLEDGYGYQCTDTLMEDRRFSSRSKINFFLEFLRSNSKWR